MKNFSLKSLKLFDFSQYLDLSLAIVITLIISFIVLNYDISSTHDGFGHLTWNYYWNNQILNGQLYPKWFEEAFGGLGSPSFVFYPPLFRIFSFPFGLLHFLPSQQVKGAIILVLIFNILGVVKLSQILFPKNSLYTLITIFFGIFNPYLIVCILKRGASGELLGITIIPWLMIGIYWALSDNKKPNIFPLILAFTALFISHIPSSVIFVSSFFLSISILIIIRKISWLEAIKFLIIPLVIAVFLASFFTFPLLFDVNKIRQVGLVNINEKFLLYGIFNFQFSLAKLDWERSLDKNLFLAIFVLIVTLIFGKPWRFNNVQAILITQQTIMIGWAIFMMTDCSLFVYNTISIFQKIQFPWRFLLITSSLIPYVLSYNFEVIIKNLSNVNNFSKKILVTIALIILVFINYKSAKLYNLNFELSKLQNIDSLIDKRSEISSKILETVKHKKLGEYYYLSQFGPRAFLYLDSQGNFFQSEVMEYLPNTVDTKNWLSLRRVSRRIPPKSNYPQIEIVEGEGTFSIEDWSLGKRKFRINTINNSPEIIVNIKTFYYPGWDISINPLPSEKFTFSPAKDGRMQLILPSGNYEVKIWYRGTKAERMGTLVSYITASLLIFFYWRQFHHRKTRFSSQ